MTKYPEIETPHRNETHSDEKFPENRENKAEKQETKVKEPDIRSGVPSEEFCISCLNMPEEQRNSMLLEIQQAAERILKAHGVIKEPEDLLKGEWFLKL
ncbi:MAG: hypothetical protein QUS12_06740, partial [Methanosarcina sp.]|nr:hypothetical protein [Methanosarcina sp.]